MNKALKGVLLAVLVFVTILVLPILVLFITSGLQNDIQTQEQGVTQTVVREEVTPDGVVLALNDVRRQYSLPQFSRNLTLDDTARIKCEDMAVNKYYDHKNPKTGVEFDTYIKQKKMYHNGASENLNQDNFFDSKSVVTGWMNSESHKASILDPKYTDVGVAVCEVNGFTTVVQHKAASPYQ